MNRFDFASLGSSAFAIVARKRQALVAANKAESDALDDVLDNCKCPGRAKDCACGREAKSRAASKARSEAYYDLQDAETMWAQYCEIRKADIRG